MIRMANSAASQPELKSAGLASPLEWDETPIGRGGLARDLNPTFGAC